ncbi:MAG: GAF domain-containing protein [bacterium]|nr:GAF domain-containing protein [bacterium]
MDVIRAVSLVLFPAVTAGLAAWAFLGARRRFNAPAEVALEPVALGPRDTGAETATVDALTKILRNIATATQGELDDALTDALVSVGGLTTVDRCFLGRLSDDGRTFRYEFQWCADGVLPVPENDLQGSFDGLPWLKGKIDAGQVFYVEDVAALPADAAPEKARWLGHETRSVLVIPMLDDGRVAGLLAFDSVRAVGDWRDETISLMDTLGQILVHAWQRRRADRARHRTEQQLRQLNEDLERRVDVATAELRGTNETLRQSEQRYRRIIENLGELQVFFSVSVAGEYRYVSPTYRRILGCSGFVELRKLMGEWLRRTENSEAREHVQRTLNGSREPIWDLRIETSEGPRVLEVLAVPLFDRSGAVTSIEGVARDVTGERDRARLMTEARERLLESEKLAALGDMVAGLTHEMATPVGTALTAASHLQSLCDEGGSAYREQRLTQSGFTTMLSSMDSSAAAIRSNLDRTAELLRSFKEVAVDQSAESLRTFDLGGYLQEIVASLGPRLRGTGYRVEVDCPGDVTICCDPGAVFRVISNLVLNSVQHGFEGLLVGTIRVMVRVDGTHVVIEYSDDGNGMTHKQLARVYEPFFTTKRGRGGTGLGMHIVHTNVTQILGGTISCASEKGRGTRVVVKVPLPAEVQYA